MKSECAAFGHFGRKPDECWTTERTAGTEFSIQKDRHVELSLNSLPAAAVSIES